MGSGPNTKRMGVVVVVWGDAGEVDGGGWEGRVCEVGWGIWVPIVRTT